MSQEVVTQDATRDATQTAAQDATQASGTAPDWRAGGFGVYVHWPFCLSRCPYCDFNTFVAAEVDQDQWRTALVRELGAMRALSGPRPVDTVFFGGGTPSLMPPETTAALIAEVDRLWGLAPGAEVTLEANPTSSEAGRFRAYAEAGVNRLSMGVQSLRDADLRWLGRTHSVAEARAAFDIARAAFARVSFDLIYARPGQSVADWRAELGEALAMAVDHLSLYQLTIEPETPFGALHRAGKLTPPPEGRAADLYEATQQVCAAAGLPAYEVSNHARPGSESRHNLIYWRYGDYAGVGPGAHGRVTDERGERLALETLRDPKAWMAQIEGQGAGIQQPSPLSGPDQAAEYMMMALRLSEGINLARFERLNGAPMDPAQLAVAEDEGLVVRSEGTLAATPRGRLVLNALLGSLLT